MMRRIACTCATPDPGKGMRCRSCHRGIAPRPPTASAEIKPHHLDMVRACARLVHNGRHWIEVDDLVGYGTIGLLNAVRDYRPRAENPSFDGWAFTRVRWAMLDGLRKDGHTTRAQRRAFKESGGLVGIHLVPLEEAAGVPASDAQDEALARAQSARRVAQALARIDGRLGRVMRLMYTGPGPGLTQRDACAEVGMPMSSASKARHRALTELAPLLACEADAG